MSDVTRMVPVEGGQIEVLMGGQAHATEAPICTMRRHPASFALVLDSAGPCFAMTLRDRDCILSPWFAGHQPALAAAGLVPDVDSPVDDAVWEGLPGAGWALRRPSGSVALIAPSEPSTALRRAMPSLLAFDSRPCLGADRVGPAEP